MHKGLLEFCKAWCGTYHINVSNCLFFLPLAYYNIDTQFCQRFWVMQTDTKTLCNAKVGTSKHDTHVPTYKGLKEEYRSTNNEECKLWFCPNDIKRCVSGNKIQYMLDWPIILNTWHVKVCTNL